MATYLSKDALYRTQGNYAASEGHYLLATQHVDTSVAPSNTFVSVPSHTLLVNCDDDALTLDFPVKGAQFVVSRVAFLKKGNAGGVGNGDNVIIQRVDSTGSATNLAELAALGPNPFDTLLDGQYILADFWTQGLQLFGDGDTLRIAKVRPAGADVACDIFLEINFI